MKAFGVEKFKSLLLAGSFIVLASYVVRLTDTLVAGNLLGSAALGGVNLVAPILSVIAFLTGLVVAGTATRYSLALGSLDKTRACQFFMQGVWSVLIFGGLLSVAMAFGADAYLAFMGASGEGAGFARDYLVWISPMAVLDGALGLLVALNYADGDSRLCMSAYTLVFVSNVLVSLLCVGVLGMGTAGCALGSVVALAAGCALLCRHFTRPTNTFRPLRHFSWGDMVRIASSSFGDAAAFLCQALLFFILDKFVIARFGEETLPVLGVATSVWGLAALFDGVGVAVQPIVTVYFAEGNYKSLRRVMGAAQRVALIEGVVLAAVFIAFPQLAVRLMGVDEPALFGPACACVRGLGVGFLALSFAGLFNSYFMYIGRGGLAGMLTFLVYLALPLLCVSVGSTCGLAGVWAGLGLGPLVGVGLFALGLFVRCGRAQFPLLLSRLRDAKLYVFDLVLSDSTIVNCSREIAATLRAHNLAEHAAARVSLVVEEVFETVKDRARGRTLLAEATLDLNNDGIQLTLRDDGEIFDITDADAQVSSLRTFLVASIMERQAARVNLVTTGFNRNVFRF